MSQDNPGPKKLALVNCSGLGGMALRGHWEFMLKPLFSPQVALPSAWAFPSGTKDKHNSSVFGSFQRHPAHSAQSPRGPNQVVKIHSSSSWGTKHQH